MGDGEAGTGALATSWHSNKFLKPARDGAVLPILHLNGYKIASPTVLARISRDELEALFRGYGYQPHFVDGDDPAKVHQLMAGTLDQVVASTPPLQTQPRTNRSKNRPPWPPSIMPPPHGRAHRGPAAVRHAESRPEGYPHGLDA